MRVAYASADFGIPIFGSKGASVHIQEMVAAFLGLGHCVSIVAPHLGQVPEGYQATVHRARTIAPDITEHDLILAERSDRVFSERRNIATAAAVEAELLRIHDEAPLDFIYERYSLWSAAGVRAARTLGIPVILELNAPLLLEQQSYRKLLLAEEAERIEQEVFRGADLIYAVSEQVRDYALSKGAHPDTTLIQVNGVDLAKFNPNGPVADLTAAADMPVIGFAGSLKLWHGLEDLVEAFRMIRHRGTLCQLLIVGEGPMRGWLDGFARGSQLSHLIHITGWLPHDRIPDYIRCMDIAVAPYPNIDGFYFSPLKLFEYMACGRAVVASNIGQIADVIQHGKSGILCEPGNHATLALCLEDLLADPGRRRRLASSAVDSMSGRSWHDCASRVVDAVSYLRRDSLKKVASR